MNKPQPIIHPPAILNAFVQLVRRYLPLDLQGTRLTSEDIFTVLGYASLNRTTIESSCQCLEQAPSGNRLREVLRAALPPRRVLQRHLNTLLRQQLPKSLLKGKRSYTVAIDLTQIPYHGQPLASADEIMRSGMRSGTTHFHGYATLSIVHAKQRYVVALVFVQLHDPMHVIVRQLLDRAKTLNIRLRRVLLEKGFCSNHVFALLDRRHVAHIVPLAVRGRSGGVRTLLQGPGRTSYRATYTLNSSSGQAYTVQAVVVCRYNKGRYHRRGVARFAYAVSGLPAGLPLPQVFDLYRQRFGIETSYRQMNQVRARTASRDPGLRLLLVGLAFLLVNLYVTLRLRWRAATDPRGQRWFSLVRLASLLIRAIEACFASHAPGAQPCAPHPTLS
jgi:hypothetical protein